MTSISLLVLGLHNCGKTSLADGLCNNNKSRYKVPTIGVNSMYYYGENQTLSITDMGGSLWNREFWSLYDNSVDMILYVIDLSDEAKFADSVEVLNFYILKTKSDRRKPVYIIGTKRDICTRDIRYLQLINHVIPKIQSINKNHGCYFMCVDTYDQVDIDVLRQSIISIVAQKKAQEDKSLYCICDYIFPFKKLIGDGEG